MSRPCLSKICLAALLLTATYLLEGCASKAIQTVPLPREHQASVLERFAAFTEQECPRSLDADLTLELHVLGKTEKARGLLQAMAPSSLRYTTLGPMDRSLYIFVFGS